MAILYELAEQAGLKPNYEKTFNHLPRRAACIPLIGGCPHQVNVEDYRIEKVADDALDLVAQSSESNYSNESSSTSRKAKKGHKAPSVFDVLGLFNDHICSQHPANSDAVERYVARHMIEEHPIAFQIDELALARKRIGQERLYASLVQPETALMVGEEAIRGDKRSTAEDQHRAFTFLKRAIKDDSIGPKAQKILNEVYESGVPPHLELEFCAIAKDRSHRYAAEVPLGTGVLAYPRRVLHASRSCERMRLAFGTLSRGQEGIPRLRVILRPVGRGEMQSRRHGTCGTTLRVREYGGEGLSECSRVASHAATGFFLACKDSLDHTPSPTVPPSARDES